MDLRKLGLAAVLLLSCGCSSEHDTASGAHAATAQQQGAKPMAPKGGRQMANVPATNGDEAEAFIARYGKPDVDQTNAFNTPRPTVVSRWLVYEHEGVHVYYLPGGIFGAKPPYEPWKILTYQDEWTRTTLSPEQVDERMQGRLLSGSTQ